MNQATQNVSSSPAQSQVSSGYNKYVFQPFASIYALSMLCVFRPQQMCPPAQHIQSLVSSGHKKYVPSPAQSLVSLGYNKYVLLLFASIYALSIPCAITNILSAYSNAEGWRTYFLRPDSNSYKWWYVVEWNIENAYTFNNLHIKHYLKIWDYFVWGKVATKLAMR